MGKITWKPGTFVYPIQSDCVQLLKQNGKEIKRSNCFLD